ncbi:MAG: hypothetical protein MJ252_27310 [archaeon]|nr:hypothetical protein [archaeon]
MDDLDISPEEENEMEPLANIYSLIRTLEFIEWAYNFGHISSETHMEQARIILGQYNTLVDTYQEKFENLTEFCTKYDLTDCKLAIKRINEGLGQADAQHIALAMELNQRFNDASNVFNLRYGNEGQIMIADFVPIYSDLINTLNKCKSLLPANLPDVVKLMDWYNLIKSRKAADFITHEEEQQIKMDVGVAYETINRILSKSN